MSERKADPRLIARMPFVVYYRRQDGTEYRGRYRFFNRKSAQRRARLTVRSSRLAGFRTEDER